MSDVVPPYAYAKDLPPKKEGGTEHPGKEAYEKACAVCHKTDAMGAPAVGDKHAWTATLKKGLDKVYENSIKGTGGMPPKGGTTLSDEKIKEIVDYMVEASK
jgi:cytochrome c